MKQKTLIIGNQIPAWWARDIIIEKHYADAGTVSVIGRDQRRVERLLSCSHHDTSIDIILAAGWHTIPGITKLIEQARLNQFTNVFLFEYYNEFHSILNDANQRV